MNFPGKVTEFPISNQNHIECGTDIDLKKIPFARAVCSLKSSFSYSISTAFSQNAAKNSCWYWTWN